MQALDISNEVNQKLLDQNWQFKGMRLKKRINQVKMNLGKKCTFLSFLALPKGAGVKAVMLNDQGGKDRVEMIVAGSIDDLKEEHFVKIQKRLGTGDYERGTDRV